MPLREIILPAAGSPYWLPTGKPPGGLLYLSWGRRRFGKHPIPPRLHHGWTYMAILSGHPVLLTGSGRRKLNAGSILIVGPDVALGWEDPTRATCSILTWVWQDPPQFRPALPVLSKLCWIHSAGEKKDFIALHNETQREIVLADDHSPDVLSAIKKRLDAAFERASRHLLNAHSRNAQRLQLAREWMFRHLDARSPVAALADYLGISAMTLLRLFRQGTGHSPGSIFLEMKMREAARRLAEPGASAKAVAIDLGYRHAGDFSRAFRHFHGYLPSSFQLQRVKHPKVSAPY